MAISDLSDLTGRVIDLDATNLVVADGGNVTTWADDTANSNDASVLRGTPTFDDGSDWHHGQPSVYFDGAAMNVTGDASFHNVNTTIVAVAHIVDWQTGATINAWLWNLVSTNPATFGLRNSLDCEWEGFFRAASSPGTARSVLASTPSTPGTHVFIFDFDGTTARLTIDGVEVATVAHTDDLDTAVSSGLVLMGHPTVTTTDTTGNLFRLAKYDRALTTAEKSDVYDWYVATYLPRYQRPASAITATGLNSPCAWLVGSTYHILVADRVNDEFDYYTAPESDPTTWTLQNAAVYTPTNPTRGCCLLLEGSTWYLFYDDRTNGHIEYASGAAITSLTHQARLFSGSVGNYYRHPAVVPPAKSHDGNWQMLMDIRTDGVTGEDGHIVTASGANLGALTEGSEVISDVATEIWRETDVGSPSVKRINGTYYCVVAGFSASFATEWRSGHHSGDAPHFLGLFTSTDFATWTGLTDNPVLSASPVAAAFDAVGPAEPEILEDGSLFYTGHDLSAPHVQATGWAENLNFTIASATGKPALYYHAQA